MIAACFGARSRCTPADRESRSFERIRPRPSPFDGFALPHWSEAIDLAKAGQRCFPMLPTLGWDVALTDAGPRIVEANARWDPPLYAPFLMSAEHWTAMFGHRDDD